MVASLVIGVAFAGFPWLISKSGADYGDVVGWVFTIHSLPGIIVAFLIGGVHGGSLTVIVLANSVFYASAVYYIFLRWNRKQQQRKIQT